MLRPPPKKKQKKNKIDSVVPQHCYSLDSNTFDDF